MGHGLLKKVNFYFIFSEKLFFGENATKMLEKNASIMYKNLLQIKAYSSRASLSHAIPVKKNIENDFLMEFSASPKSREIDRSEGFYRIMSIRRDIAPIPLGLSPFVV